MSEPDYIQLTLFPEDSLASRSLLQGSSAARRMTAISGRKCLELSESCGPLGLLEKMLLESLEWHSTMCFLTWKAKATPRGRLWFQLAASALHTNDTDTQSWPTPTAMDAAGLAGHLRKDATSTRSVLLSQKVKCLAGGGTGNLNPEWVEWLMGFPAGWTALDASGTPCAHRNSIPSSTTSEK